MDEDRSTANRRDLLLGTVAGTLLTGTPAVAQRSPRPRRAPALLAGLPDVIVVGAGAFGGWAALELCERGAKVLLVDAYGPGNPRASSGDESRLIRLSYGARDFYTRWSDEAFRLWERREQEFGRRMLYSNGSLRVMSDADLRSQRAIFERLRLPFEVLGPDEVRKRWPQVNYDDTPAIFYERRGGVLKARESMIAVAEAFERKGGTIRRGHARLHDAPAGTRHRLTVDREALDSGSVLLACGPWLPKVLPLLLGDRIRVPRREIFYVGSPIDDHRYRWENLPNLADHDTYTASDVDYGVKVAARLPDIAADPDDQDRLATPFLAQQVHHYVARRMPGLAGQPIVAARVCQTEYSDNSHFIVDRHPAHSSVWIAGAGSGHAFKMGPVLGRYIADRMLGLQTDREADALFALAGHGSAIKS